MPGIRANLRALAPAVVAVLVGHAGCIAAAPVTLPAGTTVPLTLQHHVTESRTPAGTPVYFRVARDVAVDGHVLIRAGTLVTGTMLDAGSHGASGRPETMSLEVRSVPGIDGVIVPVAADLARQGPVAPGVITYLERAATIDATVVHSISIDPERVEPLAAADPSAAYPLPLSVIEGDFANSWTEPYRLHIERNATLKPIWFPATPPAPVAESGAILKAVRLVAVDGTPVPVPIAVVAATAKSFAFDGWSIVQYCSNGDNRLSFQAVAPDGRRFASDYVVPMEIVGKAATPRQH